MKNLERRLQQLERQYRPASTNLVVRWHTNENHFFKEDTTVVRWLGAATIVLNVVYEEPRVCTESA